MHVTNGRTSGDDNGEFTFIAAQGCSVIDYCIVSSDIFAYVQEFRVVSDPMSDHMPIQACITRSIESDMSTNSQQPARATQSDQPTLTRFYWESCRREDFTNCLRKRNLQSFTVETFQQLVESDIDQC